MAHPVARYDSNAATLAGASVSRCYPPTVSDRDGASRLVAAPLDQVADHVAHECAEYGTDKTWRHYRHDPSHDLARDALAGTRAWSGARRGVIESV
jgi:hypothetical protein